MMRPEINRWFLQSLEEFETAKLSAKGEKWFAAAFWCQQSMEKALKALFIFKKKNSPGTTHSLTYLGRELNVPKDFFNLLRDLTKEYYLSRYPDATQDIPYKIYSEDEIISYLTKSEDLLKWVKLQLKE